MRPTDNLLTFSVEAAGVTRGSTLSSTTTILPDLLRLAVVLDLLVNEQVHHLTSWGGGNGSTSVQDEIRREPRPVGQSHDGVCPRREDVEHPLVQDPTGQIVVLVRHRPVGIQHLEVRVQGSPQLDGQYSLPVQGEPIRAGIAVIPGPAGPVQSVAQTPFRSTRTAKRSRSSSQLNRRTEMANPPVTSAKVVAASLGFDLPAPIIMIARDWSRLSEVAACPQQPGPSGTGMDFRRGLSPARTPPGCRCLQQGSVCRQP